MRASYRRSSDRWKKWKRFSRLSRMSSHSRGTSSEIELALAGYIGASAEASEMCRQLLRNIKSTQGNYQSMDSFLASMSDGTASSTSASAPLALKQPFPVRSNHFCTMTRSNFRQIHDRYSSIFQSIKSSNGKVARKLKIVKTVKKLSRTCLVVACGAAAAATTGAGAHLLSFGLLVGPAAAGLFPIVLWALSSRIHSTTA